MIPSVDATDRSSIAHISNYFGIETWSKEDIENAVIICKEKEGISLIDWINNTLLEMSKSY